VLGGRLFCSTLQDRAVLHVDHILTPRALLVHSKIAGRRMKRKRSPFRAEGLLSRAFARLPGRRCHIGWVIRAMECPLGCSFTSGALDWLGSCWKPVTFAKPDKPLDVDTPPSEALDRREFVILTGESRGQRKQRFLPIIRTDGRRVLRVWGIRLEFSRLLQGALRRTARCLMKIKAKLAERLRTVSAEVTS
jgi:hypothetical protein